MKLIARWASGFGAFWWDFLVGDTPELFFATVAIVIAAVLLGHHDDAGYVLLPVLAIVFLVSSIYRGRRRTCTLAPIEEAKPSDQ